MFGAWDSGQRASFIAANADFDDFSSDGRATAGPSQTMTVSASGLTGNLTVNAPNGFQVSKDDTNWASQLTYTTAAVNATVYVRLQPTGATDSGNITIASAGFDNVTVAVQGYDVWQTAGFFQTYRFKGESDGLLTQVDSQESGLYSLESSGALRPTISSGVVQFRGSHFMWLTQNAADACEINNLGMLVVCSRPTGTQVIGGCNGAAAYSALNRNALGQLVANDDRATSANLTRTLAGLDGIEIRWLWAPRNGQLTVGRSTTTSTGGSIDDNECGPFAGGATISRSGFGGFWTTSLLLAANMDIYAIMFTNQDPTSLIGTIEAGLIADGSMSA